MSYPNGYTVDRASVRQKKTGRPVRFELTEPTRQTIDDYIKLPAGKKPDEFLLFTGRRPGQCMTTRQYARLLSKWLTSIRTRAASVRHPFAAADQGYPHLPRTGSFRAVQLLLGHTKIEHVRYLGIEVDDAIAIADQVDI